MFRGLDQSRKQAESIFINAGKICFKAKLGSGYIRYTIWFAGDHHVSSVKMFSIPAQRLQFKFAHDIPEESEWLLLITHAG